MPFPRCRWHRKNRRVAADGTSRTPSPTFWNRSSGISRERPPCRSPDADGIGKTAALRRMGRRGRRPLRFGIVRRELVGNGHRAVPPMPTASEINAALRRRAINDRPYGGGVLCRTTRVLLDFQSAQCTTVCQWRLATNAKSAVGMTADYCKKGEEK